MGLATIDFARDGDGDGFDDGIDCDDGDPAVYPGAEEICNGVDDDCDGTVDEGCGFWWVLTCNDPCNCVDDDGDGQIDEDCVNLLDCGGELCNCVDDDGDGKIDEECCNPGDERYSAAYFDRFPGSWHQGDFAEWTANGGMVIHGRSDATLNPGGVRIGTAEIYAQVEAIDDVHEALVIGQAWDNDTRVVLFIVLAAGAVLDDDLGGASSGNGNGVVDAGETLEINLTALNAGGSVADSVTVSAAVEPGSEAAFDLLWDGARDPARVFVGSERLSPAAVPFTLDFASPLLDYHGAPPMTFAPDSAATPGIFIWQDREGWHLRWSGGPDSVLVSGQVTVFIEDEDGREIILTYLNKGDFIGEMGLFMPMPKRSVMVRTRSSCELAEISYNKLEQLFESDLRPYTKDILYALGRQLTDRLAATSQKVSHLAFLDVTGRIAGTLLELCKQPDAMTHPDGMQIRITRQEIGRIVGCSREMAGRVLKNLEEQGLISVSGKTIVVFGTR